MTLPVELSSRAFEDLRRNAAWWAKHRSQSQAERWYDGFHDALKSLSDHPERYCLARENGKCEFEVRELHYGLGTRPNYRAIYSIQSERVYILAVLHAAQQDLSEEELREAMGSSMRPWKLAETNYAYVKANRFEVAVLPLGATEPHNLHLPYGTDTFEADAIGEHVCAEAHARGARVVLLPAIPYGTETNMRELPLAMNLQPSTVTLVIRDLVQSLVQSGIRKVVLLNSHGGNELKPVLRELYGSTPAHLFLCNWYANLVRDKYHEIFESPEDHAGEMETSLALAYFPEFVAMNAAGKIAADDGATNRMRLQGLEAGWVSITRPWHLLTTNTGSGNPHAATADKGRRVMDLIVDRLASFLVELSAAEIDDRFPFV